MIEPTRIQRKRTKGWYTPANTVYVGRPSIWGNPFTTAEEFEKWLYAAGTLKYQGKLGAGAEYRLKVITKLNGKNLACWCPLDKPCHADVLLRLANGL